MEALKFNLQIEMFTTNNDEWENKDSFYCVFNQGYFRNCSSGNCYTWNEEMYYYVGKVEKNRYGSHDLVIMNNKSYRNEDEALEALAQIAE